MSSAAVLRTTRAAPPTPASAIAPVLGAWVRTQSLNLYRHTLALRPFAAGDFGSAPASPTAGHLAAVNGVLARLRAPLLRSALGVRRAAEAALARPTTANLQQVVARKHAAHARVLAVEKVWDCYLELFSQRQTSFGPWLLGCDRIALDCYQMAYTSVGTAKPVPTPGPFSYMRTGFGPATYRRLIPLSKLGRERNPFPLIHLPYHRLVNPWTLGAILHEVSHNLHTDLGLDRSVPLTLARTLLPRCGSAAAAVWTRWNRETFADLSGLLLGGPCVVASLMDVVGRDPRIVYHYDPRGVHPVPWLRVLLSCHLLERMGFPGEAAAFRGAWLRIYPRPPSGSMPMALANGAERTLAAVVDTLCYQPFAALGGKRLSEMFRFAPKEQRMVEEAAGRLGQGMDPGIIPPRFLIGAARVALDQRLAKPKAIREHFYRELGRR